MELLQLLVVLVLVALIVVVCVVLGIHSTIGIITCLLLDD